MSQRASLWGPLTGGLAGLPRGHLINKPHTIPLRLTWTGTVQWGLGLARAHLLPQTYLPPLQGTLGSLVRLVLGVKVSGGLRVKLGYLLE